MNACGDADPALPEPQGEGLPSASRAGRRLGGLSRRGWLAAAGSAVALALGGCAQIPVQSEAPPVVFVHGNGDSAALWSTTVWRFESNGWPRERLHALQMPYPLARDADDRPQPGRSASVEQMRFLAAEVDKVLAATGARQVVLMGNSRGGLTIRHYLARGGGADKVSHVILGGTPNHGVWSNPGFRPTNEFNGAGPLLQALNNQGAPGVEITPGPRWMTVRSDNNDKFAQPDGLWIGARSTPTNVGHDSPALRGAQNTVLPGIDHRETSFSPQAFAEAFRFITGREPLTTDATGHITPQTPVVLDGTVTGLGINNDPKTGTMPSNLPLRGARVEIHATDPTTGERLGAALLSKTVGADGRWGPLSLDVSVPLEFVVQAEGYATTHIYRAPFLRSSTLVHLRAERLADADKDAGAVITLTRPRGYIGTPRDRASLDGQSPPPGIVPGVAGLSTARLKLPAAPPRPVVAEFNGERVVGRSWPAAEGRVVWLEIHR